MRQYLVLIAAPSSSKKAVRSARLVTTIYTSIISDLEYCLPPCQTNISSTCGVWNIIMGTTTGRRQGFPREFFRCVSLYLRSIVPFYVGWLLQIEKNTSHLIPIHASIPSFSAFSLGLTCAEALYSGPHTWKCRVQVSATLPVSTNHDHPSYTKYLLDLACLPT